MEGVVSVFPNGMNPVCTTRSWDFMRFPERVVRVKTVESNIIIGILDSGIWPEAKSFNDAGFGPPPSKWKGSCQGLTNFTCNNKIVGARYYKNDGKFKANEILSPRDSEGHGTHTASIIAGGLIGERSFYDLAKGTVRGGVPSSRIAAYKVCWRSGCSDLDILAAFDDAINDGVDIISVSIASSTHSDYFKTPIAIGSFHAMRQRIMTSMAGGNYGPKAGSVLNVSPWAITVASSTTDRNFVTDLKLGNGLIIQGSSLNVVGNSHYFPLLYSKSKKGSNSSARFCEAKSLSKELVKDKVIVCDQSDFPSENFSANAFLNGANGLVVITNSTRIIDPKLFVLAATEVNGKDGTIIENYNRNIKSPVAMIMKSTEVIDNLAPYISSFSSRGPNPITSDILKPDLCAPGVNILAAWTPKAFIGGVQIDYNIFTGSSMACPHVTAAAAYVKSFYPSWSPSAIKSALMTTATVVTDTSDDNDREFSYGAGHLNPKEAINPGLVYDANVDNYISFLCGHGYNDDKLKLITGDNSTCKFKSHTALNLNLPSFTYRATPSKIFKIHFIRTITNVGLAPSTYYATIIGKPQELKMKAEPGILSFSSIGQTRSFSLSVHGAVGHGAMYSSYLFWKDGTHKVKSPIVIYSHTK